LATDLIQIDQDHPLPEAIERAAAHLRRGDIVAIPTEALYVLVADPLNLHAVGRVFAAKGREIHRSLPMLVSGTFMAEELAKDLSTRFHVLARHFWPGPLTMIVPAASHLPLKVTANTGNVALRVPASEIPLAVLRAAKIPITATSANLSGETECTTAEEVQGQMRGRISLIVDGGQSPRTISSTIVHFREDGTWQILREGAIPAKDIVEALS